MLKQKVIFNACNIIKGGALQAAVNFISINLSHPNDVFDWFFILTKEVEHELLNANIALPTGKTLVLQKSSAKNKEIVKEILAYEAQIKPTLIYTLFGPCYVNFHSLHLSGFANGWVTHSSLKVFARTYKNNWLKITKAIMKYLYYGFHIRKADGWVFETNTAKFGFIKRLKVKAKHCFVVPNTCIDFGDNFTKVDTVTINNKILNFNDKLIVALAADYPHKNLAILLNVVKQLKDNKLKEKQQFKLVLTLDDEVFNKDFMPFILQHNLQTDIVNLGKVNVADLAKLYSVAYASILPSFIETFSAVYPESFATNTPIITSNEQFAQEICQEAAIYINPTSVDEMANAINLLLSDSKTYNSLLKAGNIQYKQILSPNEKYQEYLNVIGQFIQNQH